MREHRFGQSPPREEAAGAKTPGDLGSKVPKDLEEAFRRMLVKAVTLTGAKIGALVLISPTSKKPVPLAYYSPDGPQPSQREYARIAQWVAMRRAPAIIDQGVTDPRLPVPDVPMSG